MRDDEEQQAEVADGAKESADIDEGLKHEPQDTAQNEPDDEDSGSGPGFGDAFRGGS